LVQPPRSAVQGCSSDVHDDAVGAIVIEATSAYAAMWPSVATDQSMIALLELDAGCDDHGAPAFNLLAHELPGSRARAADSLGR